MVSAAHRKKIADYLQIGVDEGAELVVDGGLGCMLMDRVPRPGFNQNHSETQP